MIRLICTDISSLGQSDYQRLYHAASPERQRRADRYLHWEDSLRCVAADALLRYALGADTYTVEPDPLGKPRVREFPHFHYNLSHAGRWVVIACGKIPVGVDVERHRVATDCAAIARRYFSPEEQQVLAQAQEPCRAFYEIWTGKESYLKYLGTGLAIDLRSFSIYSLEAPLRISTMELSEGYTLSLCTAEDTYSLEQLDGRFLL